MRSIVILDLMQNPQGGDTPTLLPIMYNATLFIYSNTHKSNQIKPSNRKIEEDN